MLYVREDQAHALRALSHKLDKPMARIFREAVDRILKHYKKKK